MIPNISISSAAPGIAVSRIGVAQASRIAVAGLLSAATLMLILLPSSTSLASTHRPIVVTIKPIHSLVAGVMAGVGEPYLLVRRGASPHGLTLQPSDARALTHAAAIIRVSKQLEVFLGRALGVSQKSAEIVSLIDIEGLTLHRVRDGGAFGAHDHSKQDGQADAVGHGGIDTHVWLDPQNAKLIVTHVAKVLSKLRPGAAKTFQANAKALYLSLDALSDELESQLRPLAGKPYIVFHDAYQYLERRYGLSPVGAVALSPDQPPGPRTIRALRAKVKRLHARCAFSEPQFRPRLLRVIVEGSTSRLGVLDPIGASLPPGPELYFTLMRNLAKGLENCLQ